MNSSDMVFANLFKLLQCTGHTPRYLNTLNELIETSDQRPGIQCFLKYKVDLKLRMKSLAYENVHLEITEIITISCIR